MTRTVHHRLLWGAVATVAAVALAGCSSATPASTDTTADETAQAEPAGGPRIALTYEGGLLVVDGDTLETIADIPVDEYVRINTAGDTNGHVFVTTAAGFQVLDTGLVSGTAELTDVVFPAQSGSHAVAHDGRTALFADGTGDVTLFDTNAVTDDALPPVETVASEHAHHGVAVPLSDGSLVTTLGTAEDGAWGVHVLDAAGEEITRFEDCPGLHGEGTVTGETVVIGCHTGPFIYHDGEFVKLTSPDEFGRVGNMYTDATSEIAVGDYKNDPDQEGYLLTAITLIDTADETLKVVDLPDGASYTWRGVGRDADSNAVVLSSDGKLYVIDEVTGDVLDSWDVIAPWEGPEEWQLPHPALATADGTAYVTEPATQSIHKVDVSTGQIETTGALPHAPAEIVIVDGHGH
ncbi:hypothetical protein [Microbacterium sp.]|uniref:hypothetical protein n=1 Tax=Microbacterium sp. TaxID=51671 RepID=UPI003A8A74A2